MMNEVINIQDDEDEKINLHEGVNRLGLTWDDLWVDAHALGSNLSLLEIEAYVLGLLKDPHEHNVLAQALNERFMDQGLDHLVAYTTLTP